MANNLQMYHKVLNELCQWNPRERITRTRNMAFLLVGLVQGRGIHLSQIVAQWPGLEAKEPSLVNSTLSKLLQGVDKLLLPA